MGQKASAPVAFGSGRAGQSVAPEECNHTQLQCSAVEGLLAVVYYHGLMRRRDLREVQDVSVKIKGAERCKHISPIPLVLAWCGFLYPKV